MLGRLQLAQAKLLLQLARAADRWAAADRTASRPSFPEVPGRSVEAVLNFIDDTERQVRRLAWLVVVLAGETVEELAADKGQAQAASRLQRDWHHSCCTMVLYWCVARPVVHPLAAG
jgi:hypothetical protein